MFCRKCGKEIPDDSVFCTGCGLPTGITTPNSNQPQPLTGNMNNVGNQQMYPVTQGVSQINQNSENNKKSGAGKSILITLLIIFGAVILVVVIICMPIIHMVIGGLSSDNEDDYPEISAVYSEKWPKNRFEAVDMDHAPEVLAEYTLPSWIFDSSYHVMIVRNNYSETVDIETNSVAYNSNGKVVSSSGGSIQALGSKCISIISELHETPEQIDHYDTSFSTSGSGIYKSAIPYLSYDVNEIKDGAVISVTNMGNYSSHSVEGTVLYFLDGELVDKNSKIFANDDLDFKPQTTITEQFSTIFDFDSIEFYLEGYYIKGK